MANPFLCVYLRLKKVSRGKFFHLSVSRSLRPSIDKSTSFVIPQDLLRTQRLRTPERSSKWPSLFRSLFSEPYRCTQ